MKLVLALVLCFALNQALTRIKNVKPRDVLLPESALKTRLPAKSAGTSNVTRIVGGLEAKEAQFPWQVSITMDDAYFCGGSVISNNFVMTAGHCVYDVKSFVLVFGSRDPDGDPGSVKQTSREGKLHENYDAKTSKNDIGLVKLTASLTFTTRVSQIRLPFQTQVSQTFFGATVTISGWGLTSDSANSISSKLKYVDLKVISNVVCAQTFGTAITKGNICTSADKTHATCNGDSGGPLIYKESDGINTVIGIVSFGAAEGCEKGYPDVFTRVTEFLAWLIKNAGVTIRN